MWRTEAETGSAPACHVSGAGDDGPAAGREAPAAARSRALAHGLWLPMVTPLHAGELDLACAQRLALHYAEAGVDGLILLGTTGEGGLLRPWERLALVAAVTQALDGAVPVMAGVGGVDTAAVCEQVRQLDRCDVAGYLVPPPYYLRVGDAGMAWHFEQVAAATWRPLMLYNVPGRTGCSLSAPLIARLAVHPRIVAIKQCEALALGGAGTAPLDVFCGEDAAMLVHLLAGGAGAVPASAHVRPDLFVRLARLVRSGHHEAARALFAQLQPLVGLMFSEPNPVPVKAALALCGLVRAEVRRPLQPASAGLVKALEQALAGLPA